MEVIDSEQSIHSQKELDESSLTEMKAHVYEKTSKILFCRLKQVAFCLYLWYTQYYCLVYRHFAFCLNI